MGDPHLYLFVDVLAAPVDSYELNELRIGGLMLKMHIGNSNHMLFRKKSICCIKPIVFLGDIFFLFLAFANFLETSPLGHYISFELPSSCYLSNGPNSLVNIYRVKLIVKIYQKPVNT